MITMDVLGTNLSKDTAKAPEAAALQESMVFVGGWEQDETKVGEKSWELLKDLGGCPQVWAWP